MTYMGAFDASPSLYHYGILGMKWGVRRYQNPDGSYTAAGKERYNIPRSTRRAARKDAREYARAKMFYGEGAGNRRKLINNTVKQRSKDPAYKEEFERQLARQDMAKHAAKARKERHRKDVVNTTAKTARGLKNAYMGNIAYASTGAAALYAAAHYTGLDRKIMQYAKASMNQAAQYVKNRNRRRNVNDNLKFAEEFVKNHKW